MATFIRPIAAKLQLNEQAPIETVTFNVGDQVTIIKEWDRFYLVRDKDGHYYNLPKDVLQK